MCENKAPLDHFLERLDELNIKICPCMEMEEKYCKYHKAQVEDLTGGFCTCKGDHCHLCETKLKVWNECIGWYVDKDYYKKEEEKKEQERLMKLDRENHKIIEWTKGGKKNE